MLEKSPTNWGRALKLSLKPASAGELPEKKTLYSRERDEKARNEFLQKIRDIPTENLLYLDESGIDYQCHRPHARSVRGQKVEFPVCGAKPHARVSLIAALHQGVLKAAMRFEGHTDSDVFNAWIQHCLMPELRPGLTVVLDNASFHKSPKTRQLIEQAGCTLLALPSYSPDFNPIEHCWHTIKARLRQIQPQPERFLDTLDSVVCNMCLC